jgi:hypothetical protein
LCEEYVGGWTENWFYVRCIEGEGWPRASTLSPFQFQAFPHFAVEERDQNDYAFDFVVVACIGQDLVDEYLACGVWPLGQAGLWVRLPENTSLVLIGRF